MRRGLDPTRAVLVVLFVCGPMLTVSHGVEIFSEGMGYPQTIKAAPADFGAYGGDLFITDTYLGAQKIWWTGPSGGTPATFVDLPHGTQFRPMDGAFLPAGWGDQSGKLLVFAENGANAAPGVGPPGDLYSVASNGAVQYLGMMSGAGTNPTNAPLIISPRVAKFVPSSFGSGMYAGRLAVTDFQGEVHLLGPVVQPDNTVTFSDGWIYDHNLHAGTPTDCNPWGMAFAPAGFGDVGGQMLLADVIRPGRVIAVSESGAVTPFTNVPLLAGQYGLRNLEFGPENFFLKSLGIPGQQLFVSVAAPLDSTTIFGDILALDEHGNVVASLRTFYDLAKFNPRDLYFTPDGLLICDLSDPIIVAQALDFRPGRFANVVPEPASLVVWSLLAVAVAGYGWRRSRAG